jgi:hypothetical protein
MSRNRAVTGADVEFVAIAVEFNICNVIILGYETDNAHPVDAGLVFIIDFAEAYPRARSREGSDSGGLPGRPYPELRPVHPNEG